MKQSRLIAVLLGGVLLLVVLGGVLAYNRWLAMPTIRPHGGDGHFENRSFRFPGPNTGVPIPGYTIDFPEFDLSKELDASYRFEKLPTIPDHDVGVYLSIWDPQEKWRSDEQRGQLTAQVQIDVSDESGTVVCRVQQLLAKMTWAQPEGGDYGLYDLDESFFVPRPGARYTLRVRYSPDTKFSGLKGFVHFRCGGSI